MSVCYLIYATSRADNFAKSECRVFVSRYGISVIPRQMYYIRAQFVFTRKREKHGSKRIKEKKEKRKHFPTFYLRNGVAVSSMSVNKVERQ